MRTDLVRFYELPGCQRVSTFLPLENPRGCPLAAKSDNLECVCGLARNWALSCRVGCHAVWTSFIVTPALGSSPRTGSGWGPITTSAIHFTGLLDASLRWHDG